MLTDMTEEQPPEGLETKDVHTMSGGTSGGEPGYRPAGVPNQDVTNVAPAEQGAAGADEQEATAADSDSGSSSPSSSRKTTSTRGSSKS